MSFDLQERVRVLNAMPNIDESYGNYNTLQEACLAIPKSVRVPGRTVNIYTLEAGSNEYWWKNGIEDSDLVLKLVEVVDSKPFVEVGEITTTQNSVNIGLHSSGENKLHINGIVYSKNTIDAFSFTPVNSPNLKQLVVYALPDSQIFYLAEGVEGLEAVKPQNIPVGATTVVEITATSEGESIDLPNVVGYKQKSDDNWQTVQITQDREGYLYLGQSDGVKSSIDIKKTINVNSIEINGLGFKTDSKIWNGRVFKIKNSTDINITLNQSYGEFEEGVDIFIIDRSGVIKPNEVATMIVKGNDLILVSSGNASFPAGTDGQIYEIDNTKPEKVKPTNRLAVAESAITTEASNRAAADNILQQNINTEAIERQNADALKLDKPTEQGMFAVKITASQLSYEDIGGTLSQAVQAFNWGNHASAGYLKIGDLDGQATQTWVSTNFIPKTHPTFEVTEGRIAGWDAAHLNSHFHNNKTILDGIAAENINNWNEAHSYSQIGHIPLTQKGIKNGVATLDNNGLIPPEQLPSYVDDVIEAENMTALNNLPLIQKMTGKIYVALDTNRTYRWSGTQFIMITTGEVDSVNGKKGVVTINTSDIPEGSNLYYTESRARQAINQGTGITYDKSTGAVSVNYGTSSSTAAAGNDARINNGQTAYDWGNHSLQGYLKSVDVAGFAQSSWVTANFTPLTSFNDATTDLYGQIDYLSGQLAIQWDSITALGANKADTTWVSTNYIPKTHPIYNVTQAQINSWNNNLNRTYSFAEITNKPTTVAGYGITDAYTKTETNTEIKNSIDAIQIGGRNYQPNGKVSTTAGFNAVSAINSLTLENGNELRIKGGNKGYVYFPDLVERISSDQTVTIGFKVKNNGTTQNTISVTLNGNGGPTQLNLAPASAWQDFVRTVRISDYTPEPNLIRLLMENYNDGSFDISVKEIYVVIGNKAVGWIPALEDQVSDWNQSDETAFNFIKNKPVADIARGVQAFNWGNHTGAGYAKAQESAKFIGFSGGSFPSSDGSQYPYMYFDNGATQSYIPLATQAYVQHSITGRSIKTDLEGGIYNGSDSRVNTTWFDYNWAGSNYPGSVINFSGVDGGYSTELFAGYGDVTKIGVRTRNGDSHQWNEARWLLSGNTKNGGNFNPGIQDVNTITRNGAFGVAQGSTNTPTNSHYNILNINGWEENDLYQFQLASHFFDDDYYLRRKQNAGVGTNWKNWVKIWHSGNFNPANYTTVTDFNDTTGDIYGQIDYMGGLIQSNFDSIATLGTSKANTTWVNTNFIPKSHPVFNVTQAQINKWDAGVTYTQGTNIVISGTTISVASSPTFAGNVTAPGFFMSSSRKLKKNIKPFENPALDLIDNLKIVSFDYKKGSKNKVGIIAEDSHEIFLSENKDAVDLYNTVYIQAKAIQELKKEIEELKKMINHVG